MWFLIRTAFWFSLVLMALPIFVKSGNDGRTDNDPKVQVSDALTAASGVVQYVGSMCSEKPDVCVKGGETLTALGYQAREGARVALDLIDNKLSKKSDQPNLSSAEAAAEAQPMPAKRALGNETADAVVTGTVKTPSFIPIPRPRPTI